ncbi:hypothetical protein [Treponema endosymbiont of Eucomonympha sp.]|nr:hypothetical protein [Treponema endosymbiont of Eucomonympha sp.]
MAGDFILRANGAFLNWVKALIIYAAEQASFGEIACVSEKAPRQF